MCEPSVVEIEWSEERDASEEVRYNHVVGETPIGMFLITWKSWKDQPSFCIDDHPFDDKCEFFEVGRDLDDAKQKCQAFFNSQISKCLNRTDESAR